MSFIIRSLICNKIVEAVSGFPIGGRGIKPSELLPYVKICPNSQSGFEYQLEFPDNHYIKSQKKKGTGTKKNVFSSNSSFQLSELVEKISVDDTVISAYYDGRSTPKVKLKVCPQKFITDVLSLVSQRPESFWKSSALFTHTPKQRVIVEYSSPNIAKPFHMGHLRSTIIGNFISNLHSALDHKVTRINYLGDWGTQFALLKYGYDKKEMKEEDLKKDAIKSLYNLYVWVNSESKKSDKIITAARNIFNSMERGESQHLKTWEMFRNISIKDYKKVYERLNVHFDEYHGESMYNIDEIQSVIKSMEQNGLLSEIKDGRKVYYSRESHKTPGVTIIKSDGSTMYITRDISAAEHRYMRYEFDKMYYVVDNSQHDHFTSLKRILSDIGHSWSDRIEHLKFGRIQGMSTRKGTAVFLEDVLNEAQDLMLMKQEESKNTSLDDPSESKEIADIVGASAIIVADLKRRRMKDYTFSWENALQSSGNTGVRLQYTHCRLVRLERNCGVVCGSEVDSAALVEHEALNLVRFIARYDEVLHLSCETLESCILVQYLFDLSTAINRALKSLPVKNSAPNIAEARLKLFIASRITLKAGMKVLGLKPLEQM